MIDIAGIHGTAAAAAPHSTQGTSALAAVMQQQGAHFVTSTLNDSPVHHATLFGSGSGVPASIARLTGAA